MQSQFLLAVIEGLLRFRVLFPISLCFRGGPNPVLGNAWHCQILCTEGVRFGSKDTIACGHVPEKGEAPPPSHKSSNIHDAGRSFVTYGCILSIFVHCPSTVACDQLILTGFFRKEGLPGTPNV